MKKNYIFVVFSIIIMSGCASTKLNPGAEKVLVTSNPAEKNCKFKGLVHGHQGNWLTGEFTSHKNLELGALNDIRNSAHAIGANFVQIELNRAGVVGGGSMSSTEYGTWGHSSSEQTSTVVVGNAYYCPNLK